jgi:long-chain acyl-CoA synthetase
LRIIDRMAYVGALKDGAPYAPRLLESKLKFLPYVREAVAFGDGRDMVCALIDIEMAATSRWADRQSISYTGHADLASRDEVYALIADCIATVNAHWRPSRRWRNRRSIALSSWTGIECG